MPRAILLRLSENFFRRWWLYLLPVVILTVAAAAYFFLAKPKYQAQGIIYVQADSFLSQLTQIKDNSGNYWTTPATLTSNEINELLQTDAFIRVIIQSTPLEEKMDDGPSVVSKTISDVRKSVWAQPMGNNQVIVIAAFEEAAVAPAMVDGAIQGYLSWKVNSQRSEKIAALNFFTEVIKEYQAELDRANNELKQYLADHPLPLKGDRTELELLEINQLQGKVQLAQAQLASALEKEENARLAIAQIDSDTNQNYVLIDSPHLLEKPITSRRETALEASIFIVVGLIFSVVMLVGSTLLNQGVLLPGDVYQQLNLPVLALLPDSRRPRKIPVTEVTVDSEEEPEDQEVKSTPMIQEASMSLRAEKRA